jgi:cytochrome c553
MPSRFPLFAVMLTLAAMARPVDAAPALRVSATKELAAVLRATPNPDNGEHSFANCIACHGDDGRGETNGAVPAIAGQHFSVIAKQLVDFRHGRRWDLRMEHVTRLEALGTAQNLADVAAYVANLPPSTAAGQGTGEYLDSGAQAYTAGCSSCHGGAGQGRAAGSVPRLAAQHYNYLVRQIFDGIDQRRPNLDAAHVALMKALSREQIMGICDYLSRARSEDR